MFPSPQRADASAGEAEASAFLRASLRVEVRQDPVQRAGYPPGGAAQQRHHRRDEQQPYDGGVDEHAGRSPRPSIFTTMLSLMTNAAKTLTMISAAQVMTRAVISSTCATLARASPVRTHASWMRESRKIS